MLKAFLSSSIVSLFCRQQSCWHPDLQSITKMPWWEHSPLKAQPQQCSWAHKLWPGAASAWHPRARARTLVSLKIHAKKGTGMLRQATRCLQFHTLTSQAQMESRLISGPPHRHLKAQYFKIHLNFGKLKKASSFNLASEPFFNQTHLFIQHASFKRW